jgi:D-psicose/D-tagatose/L-ribulose 3-epimerase
LKDIQYDGPVVIESFTTEITEIAKAVSLWRPLAESQDALAENGLKFLKRVFQDSHD